MSDFFDSEIIQEELKEINKLQEKIYGSLFNFGMMSKEDKIIHQRQFTQLTCLFFLKDLLSTVKVFLKKLS